MFEAADCSHVPDSISSDAGIAGTGVLLSFVITAGLSLVLSASLIFRGFSAKSSPSTKPGTIRRQLLLGYSDQQIMTGIGIQSIGLAQVDTLVPYHFFLIWMLGLLSMAVHNATLLALVRDFRRDWVLRWLRQALMFVNLALSCVCGVYIMQSIHKNLEPTLPIYCVWNKDGRGARSDAGVAYLGTAAAIIGNCVVFGLATWYLHSRAQRFYKTIQMVGLILMTAIAIGATARIFLLSQAFGKPSVHLTDDGEKTWSFGQLLSLLLLLLPLVSSIEIYRGELEVPLTTLDEGEKIPSAEPHESLQPNPFFGSRTSLCNK